ncbi:MAG TPA: hypothetical protein VFF68_03105 [Anaerolineaceae bacterium]|nr:hypothetical protein [Anaerolineaceae bacterium]
MTPETINALIQLGAAGAVIIVVFYFLRFIAKRDEQWQQFFEALMANRETPIVKLTEAIEELLGDFRAHDTWEHTKLDEMSARINRPTRPRKGGNP